MEFHSDSITGLTNEEVLSSRKEFGTNSIQEDKSNTIWLIFFDLVKEPMVLLLLMAAVIYFITGHTGDAIFLASAIILVAAISIYQNNRSKNALAKLKEYASPLATVIRNGVTLKINSKEIVMGDYMIVEEGNIIPADGIIIQCNDFSVDESILTGESLSVFKSVDDNNNEVYHGTLVNSGLAIVCVKAIGKHTRLGHIGQSLDSIEKEKTPLEIQISNFVKKMVIAGSIVFMIVWAINYYLSQDVLDSLLKALTLAMSILPEEIPVAFTTFMAMGAWRLMKEGIIVKQMQTVEALGSATVICSDKTGTITQNKMQIIALFVPSSDSLEPEYLELDKKELIRMSMWSSEPIPFDPMEIAIHEAYSKTYTTDERSDFKMYHEYPLEGKPPMMTHIFENEASDRIIAAKGAPEAILKVCNLDIEQQKNYQQILDQLAASGYRVLGVAKGNHHGDDFPRRQQEIPFEFIGFIAFYDPPKDNTSQLIQDFQQAGIQVKIITGDNALTTKAIADQIQFPNRERILEGEKLLSLSDEEQNKAISDTHIFTRMYPEAKLKIINTT